MTRDEVVQSVRTEIAGILGIPSDSFAEDASLVDDLGADSLDLIEILMPVEEALGVGVDQGQLNEITTVSDLVELLLASPHYS